jgi:LuxR family quorum-sensing system transcriptional regulator SolR
MNSWRETMIAELAKSAKSETKIFQKTTEFAKKFGFEYCAYGFRAQTPITNPTVVLSSNYPQAWQARYAEKRYIDLDPSVHFALHTNRPFRWSTNMFELAPSFWAEARSHGLRHGWAFSSRDKHGSVGMLTLARSSEPISPIELEGNEVRWSWLASITHEAMAAALVPHVVPELNQKITTREHDILSWSAAGKTANEISIILNISARTVNFHIFNLLAKLNASNKVEAVCKAALLGLL